MSVTHRVPELLIPREGPAYPPHHTGDHLEEAFLKFWEAEGKGSRKLIPIHWTAVYNHRVKEGLGPGSPNARLRDVLRSYLQGLDPREKYFVVCTHDDAPAELLPPDTRVFSAGGNSQHIDVPIPLTCGPHDVDPDGPVRSIPISFVGSLTHRLRLEMAQSINGKFGVFLSVAEWTDSVSQDRVDLFKEITRRSIFSLCPRGYGATSYRLYEAMQLGAIPVYLSDKHLLPWSDEVDWSQFCVVAGANDTQRILSMTLEMKESDVRRMQDKLRDAWRDHFSVESTCRHIAKRVDRD